MNDPEAAVRALLRTHLAPLVGIAQAQGPNHNVFLEAISPTVAIASKLTRSLTSRLGKRFALIARDLARMRYGPARVPSAIYSDVMEAPPQAPVVLLDDTAVYTQLEPAATRAAAVALLRQAGAAPSSRVGTAAFREAFEAQVRVLRSGPRASEPWYVRVDLYVDDPLIGLTELESGGELDSANVKGQPEKLILAGLALARPSVPLHFALAYANQGEGRPIKGGLPKYMAYAGETRPSAGLVVGAEWWIRILPPELSFADFTRLFAEVAMELNIVPETIR